VTIARLTLIGKPECHLCDDARAVVTSVVGELDDPASVTLEELSILENPVLAEKYWDEIPVLMINGVVHNIWRIDHARLRSAIAEAIS
jgi:hypothetical protein